MATKDAGQAGGEQSEAGGGQAPVRRTGMDRRSWYMPAQSADRLAEMVEELYWETRRPKQEILAAVVELVTAPSQRERLAKKLQSGR